MYGIGHLVVHDGVDKDRDGVLSKDLLRGDLKRHAPHVDLLVCVDTGNDEEDPRTPSSSGEESAQPEDDGPLVLLDHLDGEEEGEGEGDHDEQERSDGHDEGADAGPLLTD